MMARAGLDWDYRLLDAYHKANTSMVQSLVDWQQKILTNLCKVSLCLPVVSQIIYSKWAVLRINKTNALVGTFFGNCEIRECSLTTVFATVCEVNYDVHCCRVSG